MILQYIIWIIVFYALFRLVFDVIVPIARVSGQVKRKMREFQDAVQKQEPQRDNFVKPQETKQKSGDYIDFEEVK